MFKMTRQELAELLNISRGTLNNWEKEKPELIRLINQGLALDEQIEETKKYLEKLENIQKRAITSKKINLK
ncbi:helix-turn-helix domain-containing protein [Campylobacter portucalensis]|nr:helix-turn-helix domain-containing protein [Campylobacter portucalensis]